MKSIDSFSYKLGAADCFCEMVRAGVKKSPWPILATAGRSGTAFCRSFGSCVRNTA